MCRPAAIVAIESAVTAANAMTWHHPIIFHLAVSRFVLSVSPAIKETGPSIDRSILMATFGEWVERYVQLDEDYTGLLPSKNSSPETACSGVSEIGYGRRFSDSARYKYVPEDTSEQTSLHARHAALTAASHCAL
jgi:hypothetical protein